MTAWQLTRLLIGWATVPLWATAAHATSIVVRLPPGTHVIAAAATVAKNPSLDSPATVVGDAVTLADAKAGAAYDLRLTLADRTVLQGVDLGWYSRVPGHPNAGPITDDDRQQMDAVRTKVLSFFDRADVIAVRGDHHRAVMLIDLRRESAFHGDAGGAEVIWRPELWYFENHHGGWEKVQQTDRTLRRERFPTDAAYHAVVDRLRWVPELGGLKVRPGGPDVTVSLPSPAGVAATRPATPAAAPPASAGPSPDRP